jgi:hypothetical protein
MPHRLNGNRSEFELGDRPTQAKRDLVIEMTTLEQLIQSQETGRRIAFGSSRGPRIKGQAILD